MTATTGQNQNRTYLTGLANLNTNVSGQPQAGEAVLASFQPRSHELAGHPRRQGGSLLRRRPAAGSVGLCGLTVAGQSPGFRRT